jgi:hypothetical protein
MATNKIPANCARLAGILLVAATIPHATLGTAEVLTAIKLGDVRASMTDTFRIIWVFSTMMLLLSGIWTLFVAGELRQMHRRAWWQGIFIGLGYTGGSIGCMAAFGVYTHLLLFAVIGLILLVPLIVWAGHFGPPSH